MTTITLKYKDISNELGIEVQSNNKIKHFNNLCDHIIKFANGILAISFLHHGDLLKKFIATLPIQHPYYIYQQILYISYGKINNKLLKRYSTK